MARALRLLGLTVAIALAVGWLAPALIVSALAPRFGDALGVALDLEGVRPSGPLQVSIERARVTRAGHTVELTDVRARLRTGGTRIDARVGDGSLLLRLDGLGARSGFLRAESLPLERLDGVLTGALGLRGPLDGVYRFGARETLEATIGRGAGVLHAPVAIELAFAQLVVAAERESGGGWRVDFAELHGPPVSAAANGTIGANGELDLALEVTQLEEPARSAFASAGLHVGSLPYAGRVRGTLALPLFVQESR